MLWSWLSKLALARDGLGAPYRQWKAKHVNDKPHVNECCELPKVEHKCCHPHIFDFLKVLLPSFLNG